MMNEGGALGRAISLEIYRSAIFDINRRDPDMGIVLQHHHECIEDAKRGIAEARQESKDMKVEQRWYTGIIVTILLGIFTVISTKGHP